MKFKLISTSGCGGIGLDKKYEHIPEEYNGKSGELSRFDSESEPEHWYEDAYVDINSLEDLMKLCKEVEEGDLILNYDKEHDSWDIEIYDGYRE